MIRRFRRKINENYDQTVISQELLKFSKRLELKAKELKRLSVELEDNDTDYEDVDLIYVTSLVRDIQNILSDIEERSGYLREELTNKAFNK